MGNFVLEGFKYLYKSEEGDEVLLDLEDWFSNKGRVPFHDYFDNITVSTLILNNLDAHSSFCGSDQMISRYDICFGMLDTMFIREHTRSKDAKHITEYGASNDYIQKHFLNILSELKPESEYSKGCDERKSDMVVVNGVGKCPEPEAAVHKAYENLKDGGLLLAMCIGDTSLRQEMERAFPNEKKYLLAPDCAIWKVRKKDERNYCTE
ncbi:hypothetical protein SAMN02910276_00797 [Butyrivibrio sp. Su6]|uniref:hypothetical protein n=1 Tax=Butyrivibrio sp. Su6 TaxID=1520810 RepID=UPI00089F62E9|nr:hypothetical protein [Butyrivibrio sp. Su6]SEF67018.1 hypothetical protein SAMN02910276_00797 [Butyrivibrio sp. Su6]